MDKKKDEDTIEGFTNPFTVMSQIGTVFKIIGLVIWIYIIYLFWGFIGSSFIGGKYGRYFTYVLTFIFASGSIFAFVKTIGGSILNLMK